MFSESVMVACRLSIIIMFLFHIIIMSVHFAVTAPQNSRRLSGNWREVAIYIHFHERADGFDATSSYFVCFLSVL